MIQHYPPIKEVTRSYIDGKLPPEPDPWAVLQAENAALREDAAHLLFDEAQIADGERPLDPRAFSARSSESVTTTSTLRPSRTAAM